MKRLPSFPGRSSWRPTPPRRTTIWPARQRTWAASKRRCRELASLWRDITRLSDAQAAAQVRADRIDILVDLKLHTDHNRLPLFALKPAPVQATWLGFPGTTGMDAIDYRLTDPYIDPG